jgi:hypothetical protein
MKKDMRSEKSFSAARGPTRGGKKGRGREGKAKHTPKTSKAKKQQKRVRK